MRILQLDVNEIEFLPIKPEASVYEPAEKITTKIENALVLMISVENCDSENPSLAQDVSRDAIEFMKKQKISKIVIYPFAHLSSDLESPEKAIKVLEKIRTSFTENQIDVISAPFGWNKKLKLDIKPHPLAEQSKYYGNQEASKAQRHEKERRPKIIDKSIVRKSNWSGLPETDHRTIGEKLDLYSFQEVSPGMVYWHSNGFTIYKQIVNFIREKLEEYDFKELSTPILANTILWSVSGHIDHYRSEMFVFNSENEELGLKPMGCPSVMLVYKSRKWSYKELPFRAAEFDMVHRNEVSGALTGLFRVRQITQDDSHTFAREDQIEEEITSLLKMAKEIYSAFGLKFMLKLSTMPDSHLGDETLWNRATIKLRNALENNNIGYGIKEKDGAFYGPKIDGQVLDAAGREWQCLTIQLDYQLPQRFNLEFTGEDGKEHTPVVIHKTIIGSLERFIGILTEHYKGKFPLWLAPIQVRVIPISEPTNKYAEEIYKKLRKHKIRAEIDASDKTLEYKIRDSQLNQVPYALIVGKKEEESSTISVRSRDAIQKNKVELDSFIESLKSDENQRSSTLSF